MKHMKKPLALLLCLVLTLSVLPMTARAENQVPVSVEVRTLAADLTEQEFGLGGTVTLSNTFADGEVTVTAHPNPGYRLFRIYNIGYGGTSKTEVWNDSTDTGNSVTLSLDSDWDTVRVVFIAEAGDPSECYQLYINGTQVTNTNCADVLGDGVFAYDPAENVLSLKGSYCSELKDTFRGSLITNCIPALTIRTEKEGATIRCSSDTTSSRIIRSYAGEMTITGPGQLQLICTDLADSSAAIYVEGNGTLTLDKADVRIDGPDYGILGNDSGNLVIRDSQVYINSAVTAVGHFQNDGIALEGVFVNNPANWEIKNDSIWDSDANTQASVLDISTDYSLWIDSTKVTSANRNDVLGDGVFSYDPTTATLTLKGSYDATILGTLIDSGLPALTIYVPSEGAELSFDGTHDNLFFLRCSGDLTVTGPGRLKVTGPGERGAQGIFMSNGNLTFDNAMFECSGFLSCVGGRGPALHQTLTVNHSVLSLDALTTEDLNGALALFETVNITNCTVTTPENALIQNGTVCNADGTWAQTVRTAVPAYDLTIANVKVDELNKDDVLGNGVFSYDPDENVLYVHGDFAWDVGQSAKNPKAMVYSQIPDLTVNVTENSLLTNVSGNAAAERIFYFARSTTMTGKGFLTLYSPGVTYGIGIGMIKGSSSTHYTLTLDNARLTFLEGSTGIEGAALAYTGLVIRDSVLRFSGQGTIAVSNFRDGVTLDGCAVTSPSGAYFTSEGRLVESDGTTFVKDGVIRNNDAGSDIYVKDVAVTDDNYTDVLGDGMFSFDPSTDTLFIHGGSLDIGGSRYGIQSYLQGLWIVLEDDVELTDRWGLSEAYIETSTDLTLTGPHTLKLGGLGAQNGILIDGYGWLRLYNTALQAENVEYGVRGGTSNHASLHLDHSLLNLDTGAKAVSGFNNGIAMSRERCFVQGAPVSVLNGDIVGQDGTAPAAMIMQPYFTARMYASSTATTPVTENVYYGETVPFRAFEHNGLTVAAWYTDRALTQPFDPETVSGLESPDVELFPSWGYPLWLGETQVTEDNCSDILGNGLASYDPDSKTLTISGPIDPGVYPVTGLESMYITSAVVYAEMDSLTVICSEATLRNADYYGAGVVVKDGSLTFSGENANLITSAPALYSEDRLFHYGSTNISAGLNRDFGPHCAVCAEDYIQLSGVLNIDCNASYAVRSTQGSIDVDGFLKINNIGSNGFGISTNVSGGNINLKQDANVVVRSINPAIQCYGNLSIRCDYLDLTTTKSDLDHPIALVVYGTITKDADCQILLPAGGQIVQISASSNGSYYTIQDAAGNTPKHILIAQEYPVWIGQTKVTTANCADVLGNGNVSFDPLTNTLTVRDTLQGADTGYYAGEYMIFSKDIDLTIDAPNGLRFYSVDHSGIRVSDGDLTVNGSFGFADENQAMTPCKNQQFEVIGSLTINGSVELAESDHSGQIYARDGVHITGSFTAYGQPPVADVLSDGDIVIDGDVVIGNPVSTGLRSESGSVSVGGNVTIEAPNGFGIWAGDTVAVSEGRWTVESRYGAIVGLHGLGLSNNSRIIVPEQGVVTMLPVDEGYLFTIIWPQQPTVPSKYVEIGLGYPLWVGQTQVSESNWIDVLGDGKVRFDPNTNTLTLYEALSDSDCGLYYLNYGQTALIYADGMDLTLADSSGTVRLTNAVNSSLREFGVYCTNGSVTIDGNLEATCGDCCVFASDGIEIEGSADLNAPNYHGHFGDSSPGALSAYGPVCVAGDLRAIANNHYCVNSYDCIVGGDVYLENLCPAGGMGISAQNIDITGSITGICTNTVLRSSSASCSIYVEGDVDLTSTMASSDWVVGKFGSVYPYNQGTAVVAAGGVTMNGDVTIRSAGNVGIYAGGELSLTQGASDITATEAAILAGSLDYEPNEISFPTGGVPGTVTLQYGGDSTQTDFVTVTESDGTTPADHVILSSRGTYLLWVEGVQVTENNKNDILGDGQVSFDPDTNTLTLDDRILTDGSWTYGEGYAVYAEGMDLTVTDTTGTVRLSPADPSASAKGIRCSGTLRVGCSLSAAEGVYAYVEAGNIYVSDDVTNCALFCEDGDITIYDNYTMDNPDGAVSIADLNARNITIWGDLMIETGGEMGANAVRNDGDSIYGTFTAHGDVYIRCTRETGNMGWGILAAQNITIDGSVDAECTAACLYSSFGDVKVSGDVSAVGTTEGPAPAGKYVFPFANGTPIIAPRGSVILSRGATVTAVACVGIFAGDKVYLDGIRSDVTASECAILAKEGIVGAPSAEIILPVNGTIGTVTINGTTYCAVTESDGTTEATHAVIEDSIFPLWVSGIRVTKQNCADIFGDGSAYFDVGTRTLTLSGAQITGSYSWSETDEWGYTANYNAAIYAGRTLGDLRIVASNGLNINNPDGMGIWVRGGNLDIQSTANGGVNVNAVAKGGVIWASGRVNIFGSANLTGTEGQGLGSGDAILVTGDLTVQGNGGTGVYAGSLEVQGDLTVQGNGGTYSTGVFCNQGGVTVGGNAVVTASNDGIEAYGDVSIGGDATVTGTNDCGVMSYKTIHITGGTWDITGGVSALGAFDGIELDENHVIELPVGGVIGMAPMSFPDGKYTRQVYAVTESDGTTAATHAIIAGVQYYDLWVAGVQVTSNNKDDVLNDGGTAVFDPATSTLTLANLSTNQVYQNSVIYSESMNLTIVPASGSLSVTNTKVGGIDYAIRIANGTLTVDGDLSVSAKIRCIQTAGITVTGNLIVTSEASHNFSLVQVNSGSISIGGDLQIDAPHGFGIVADTVAVGGDVDINLTYNNSTAPAISAPNGFTADGDVTISTTGYPIECSSGAIHINGSANLVSTGDGTNACSVTAKNGIYVGDDLTATAKTNANAGAAVLFTSNGDITVRGDMDVQNSCETGGMAVNAPYGKVEIMGIATCSSYGPCIHAGGEVKIYYGADVASSGAVGIWAGGKAIVMDGTWDVTGSGCAIAAVEGIEITGAHVIDLPVNGELADLSCQVLAGENPVTAWTVAEPGGTTPAAHAIIRQRLQTGFYLIGPDGWTLADIDEDDLFVQNPNAQGEYMLQTTLTEGDPIKVVAVQGGFVAGWFPDGLGNEYVVDAAHAGNVTIYFRTEYQSAWSQFGGYIWIEANDEPQPQYNGSLKLFYSFSLGAEITPVYTITASSVNSYVDYYVVVEKPGAAPVTIHKEDMAAYGTTAFRASYTGIAAKEMGVEFTATLYAKDQSGNIFYGPSVTKTIKNELVTRLGNTSNPAVTRTLCADMLNYGAAAQVYFGYDVENLVNANVPCIHDCETTADPEISQTSATSGEGGNIFSSPSLSNRVVLNLIGAMPGGSSVKLKVMDADGNVLMTLDTGAVNANLFQANFDQVGAKDMRTLYKFRFVDEGGVSPDSKTLTWSVESYVGRLMSANAAGTPTYELARALLIYGDSAAEYLTPSSN